MESSGSSPRSLDNMNLLAASNQYAENTRYLSAAKNSAPGRTELGGQLIKGQLGSANDNGCNGSIVRRSRLGGLLNYYHREAA
jgi:hypothetical protein